MADQPRPLSKIDELEHRINECALALIGSLDPAEIERLSPYSYMDVLRRAQELARVELLQAPAPSGPPLEDAGRGAGHASQAPPTDELAAEVVEALEEVLDHWEVAHSPLDDAGLRTSLLARRGLNHLRAELPPRAE